MLRLLTLSLTALLTAAPVLADGIGEARKVTVTQWKAVFGQIEARDQIAARSRLGGTLDSVDVSEGSHVDKGQVIANVTDEKLKLQMEAADAQLRSLQSELANARTELSRGENLRERGVITEQRLDSLRTGVDVLVGQIDAAQAAREVLAQQTAEGAVIAPNSGTVLDVPVTAGSVVLPGETIALIGGGGFFLRLAVPERHAGFLKEGDEIRISGGAEERPGTLVKIYPLIENGRVIADVEVEGLATDFVNARALVRLPVGDSEVLVVPEGAVTTRMGLDFVAVAGPDGAPVLRAVVPGERLEIDGAPMVEILTGLAEGDKLADSHD